MYASTDVADSFAVHSHPPTFRPVHPTVVSSHHSCDRCVPWVQQPWDGRFDAPLPSCGGERILRSPPPSLGRIFSSLPESLTLPGRGEGRSLPFRSVGILLSNPPFVQLSLPFRTRRRTPTPPIPKNPPYPPRPGKWTPLSLKPGREGGSIPGRSSVDHEPHHTDAMATAASTHARVRTARGISTANKGWKNKEQRGWMEAKQKKTCQTDTRVVLARATGEPGKVRHATNPARTKTKRTTKDA